MFAINRAWLAGLLLFVISSELSAAPSLPKLELGVTMLALNAPDYRGSSRSSNYFLPAPYIKYRGKRLRVDGGIQGIIFDHPDLLLKVSANLSLPADSDTPERAGMQELDAVFEIGPSLNYRFQHSDSGDWWLELPLRFAYTLNSDFDHIGQIFQPRVTWRKRAETLEDWNFRLNFGPVYSTAKHHQYFYSVAESEALPSRPAFQAEGGNSGIRVEFTYSKRRGKLWFGGFLRYDNLNNSVIEDSPLVSDAESWLGGVGVAWIFHQEQ